MPRQQTLQALIDWSWDLLTEADQRLLSRLSVFTGGWTLDAAAAVAGDHDDPAAPPPGAARLETLDGLSRLVDRSLLVVTPGETTRYGMLETIRQYGNDQLVASGDAAARRTRHLARFRRLASDARAGIAGPDMVAWLNRVEADLDNLRTALDWAYETDVPVALEMYAGLGAYWRSRSLGSEGVERMREAIEVLRRWRSEPSAMPEPERTLLGARVMIAAFNMSGYAGWNAVGSIGDETIAIARASGDPGAIVDALVLFMQTEIMTRGGRQTDGLRAAGMEALQLATDLDDPFRLSTVLTGLAMIDAQTDPEAANGLAGACGRCRPTKREPGRNRGHAPDAWPGRGPFRPGRPGSALVPGGGRTRTPRSTTAGSRCRPRASSATPCAGPAPVDEADAEYRQTIVGWQRSGNRGAVANQLESMAFTAIARGRGTRAAQLLGAAEALREASGDPMTADERDEYDAEIERLRGLLDPEALRAAWAEGRTMSSAAAVALALSA